jgi:hypothetical protein
MMTPPVQVEISANVAEVLLGQKAEGTKFFDGFISYIIHDTFKTNTI